MKIISTGEGKIYNCKPHSIIMILKISMTEERFPYKAKYIRYKAPQSGSPSNRYRKTGCGAITYDELLKHVLTDLRGYDGEIGVEFSGDISSEQQNIAKLIIDMHKEKSSLEGAISQMEKTISDVRLKQQ